MALSKITWVIGAGIVFRGWLGPMSSVAFWVEILTSVMESPVATYESSAPVGSPGRRAIEVAGWSVGTVDGRRA